MKRGFLVASVVAIGLLLLFGFNVFEQSGVSGKYIRNNYPGGYLVLSADKSFKFRFNFDSQWDIACGQFEIKGDTLFFTYTSDMHDVTCNEERINMSDTTDYFLRTGVDKRWRPIAALVKKKRIKTLMVGDTQEPTTVRYAHLWYNRVKNKGVR